MGWAVGFDSQWSRDIGYGVPAICDHPECETAIDRGLAYVCGGEPYGGEHGCGLYFCGKHLAIGLDHPQICQRCYEEKAPFTPKPDTDEWVNWKLTDSSWAQWRMENPEAVQEMAARTGVAPEPNV